MIRFLLLAALSVAGLACQGVLTDLSLESADPGAEPAEAPPANPDDPLAVEIGDTAPFDPAAQPVEDAGIVEVPMGPTDPETGEPMTPDAGAPVTPAVQLEWSKTADTHVHVSGCRPGDTNKANVLSLMKQRKINVGSILIWGGAQGATSSINRDWRNFLGQQDDPISEPDHILHWDVEISNLPGSHAGHLMMLNLADKNVVANATPGYPGKTHHLPNYKYAQDQGAIVGYAHGGRWIVNNTDPSASPVISPHELPLDVIHANVQFLADEQLNAGFLWLWYRMLDGGFQLAPSGASDNGCVNNNLNAVGIRHTVLGLEKGQPLTYASFVDAVRKGRTMIRNYAANPDTLELLVNGQPVGTEVLLPKGQTQVMVEVRGASPAGNTLQLIANGQVVKTAPLNGTPQTLKWMFDVQRSSWIAARTANAHTATVFALREGCPVRNNAAMARRWVVYLEDFFNLFRTQFGAQVGTVRTRVDQAKAAWEQIAKEAEGTATPTCKAVP